VNTPADQHSRDLMNKVPQITLFFWVIKILATTVGETAADLLNVNMGFGLIATSWVMCALLAAALAIQIFSRNYVPWKYWLAVVFLSIFGTLVTDNLVDNFGVALTITTAIFSVALIATFIGWYANEKTLSIHTIYTKRREMFYWTTILFTFALGTAAGDLVGEQFNLGYSLSALLFGGMITLVTLAYYIFKLDAVLAFWLAYILTRPFGASCGDLLSQATKDGGLGLGTVSTSILFFAVIAALVIYLSITKRDVDIRPPIRPGG
jgi:uncharacterized membrane-anchored protein